MKTSPNSRFANIKAIKKTQIEAGDHQIEAEYSDSSGDSASTIDCIEVQE